MGNSGKILSLTFVLVFLMSLVILQPITVKAQTKTIIVPDDYQTIQAAIDFASAGDIILVRKGTYSVDTIEINKSLSIIGEDSNETIIEGNPQSHFAYNYWDTVYIQSSKVLISNFTFIHCVNAITVDEDSNTSNIQIIGNKFLGNPTGINAHGINGLIVSNNYFSNNKARASTQVIIDCSNSVISHNLFTGNLKSIAIYAQNITVYGNQIFNNTFGIELDSTSHINIFGNNITDNIGYDGDFKDYGYGIEFNNNCNDTVVHDNNIRQNTNGINLRSFLMDFPNRTGELPFQGSNNVIQNNNFIDNSKNANVEHEWSIANSTYLIDYTIGTAIVSWDNGTVGNYWSDYNGNGSYVIDKNNVDHYPLTQQIVVNTTSPTPSVPEFSLLIILPLFLVILSIVVLIRKSKYLDLSQNNY
jgi:parallel beta-helix repeat protein